MSKEPTIIQQLKNNKRPFILMSEEMRAKAIEIGAAEFQRLTVNSGEWIGSQECFSAGYTFHLRPDYKQEPVIVECEIKNKAGVFRFYWESKNKSWQGVSIDLAPAIPDFIGFKFEDGHTQPSPIRYKTNANKHESLPIGWLNDGTSTVLHATHVLFRGPK